MNEKWIMNDSEGNRYIVNRRQFDEIIKAADKNNAFVNFEDKLILNLNFIMFIERLNVEIMSSAQNCTDISGWGATEG